ncbi:MAG TPA: hypothetical protein VNC50_02700 [Planctomycetia bacterium]|nr:hypothetical protein [Planctomycetia bacterium]
MPADLASLVSAALKTLLSETMFRADARAGYILNRGEPGFIETLKTLSAKTASTPPREGGKPICSHANHVLYGLELMDRALHGDAKAFENTDWDAAWRLVSVTEAEWSDLIARLDRTGRSVLEAAPKVPSWNEITLTGCFASAAHTAYHLGAIRQIMKDIE